MIRPAWKSKVFDEIHKIREKMTKESKRMSRKDLIKSLNEEANKKVLRDGYKYVSTPQGYCILKKV